MRSSTSQDSCTVSDAGTCAVRSTVMDVPERSARRSRMVRRFLSERGDEEEARSGSRERASVRCVFGETPASVSSPNASRRREMPERRMTIETMRPAKND